MRILPACLLLLAIASGFTGCDSSSDPTSPQAPALPQKTAPRNPQVDVASGIVDFGTRTTVSRDDARDTLLYSRDSISWYRATDSVFEVRDSVTYFFKVRRDSLFSGVVQVHYEVPHKAPDLTIGSRTYRTVYLGGMRWMAENLDEGSMIQGSSPQSNDKIVEKYCRGDSAGNCAIFGGLYQLSEALGFPSACNGTFCGDFLNPPTRLQGICPDGWRIPSSQEWKNLAKAAGGWGNLFADTLWAKASSYPDPYDFSILPGGARSETGDFTYHGVTSTFWTSTLDANYGTILYGAGGTSSFWGNAIGASVRCVSMF